MAVFNLFSKRQRRTQKEAPEVFIYDDIPHELRIQLLRALDDAILDEEPRVAFSEA